MFSAIFLFELQYRLDRPATYIYFGLLLLLAFTTASWDQITIGSSNDQIAINAPYSLGVTMMAYSLLGVLIASAIMGVPVFRDFDHKTSEIYFSKPITKLGYLLGRYAGSLVILMAIFSAVNIGTMLGHAMPWVQASNLQEFSLLAYWQPYLVMQLPTILVTGTIFFATGALTKRLVVIYTQGIAFFILFSIALQLSNNLSNEVTGALMDPFGFNAVELLTQYWTVSDKNTLMIPLEGALLFNRLIWLGAAALIFGITYWLFRFSREPVIQWRKRQQQQRKITAKESLGSSISQLRIPRVSPVINARVRWQQFLETLKLNITYVIKSIPFLAILAMGILFVIIYTAQAQQIYGTPVQPVSYHLAGFIGQSFMVFFLILITFYAGELYWKERDYNLSGIKDALPVPTWVNMAGQYAALVTVLAGILVVLMLTGIGIQLSQGFFDIEISTYLTILFIDNFPPLVEFTLLAFFIHVLVNNKFMGHALVILFFLLVSIGFPQMNLEHNLYLFASTPGFTYSGMNGTGPFLEGLAWFHVYWFAFSLILSGLGYLLWQRGAVDAFRERLLFAGNRLTRPVQIAMGLFVGLFLASGSYAYYNTNILNDYQTFKAMEEARARYEKDYQYLDALPQPKITRVDLTLELYPDKRNMRFEGQYTLTNKTSKPIDTVFIELRDDDHLQVDELALSAPAQQVYYDSTYPFYLYQLASPLMPGDSVKLDYNLYYPTKGFRNNGPNVTIVQNGTFINSRSLPSIGYVEANELSRREDRQEYDLPKQPQAAPMDDSAKRYENVIADDADFVDFEATVGTKKGQKAVAPGYLKKQWSEDGRSYYHYKMDEEILHFYSFLSGNYTVDRTQWTNSAGQKLPVEVYYHPGHGYNIEKMQQGAKKALSYYSENFGPYPHQQFRIFEFPRYSTFAQSFPNTVPFSEGIGFIAKVGEEDIDYPFFVTAHEVAHQWWGHQIAPAGVEGAQFLSESLSEYSALMVMKHEKGADQMRKFLEHELDDYLSGRSQEDRQELPLMRVAGQSYIAYRKGALALYALQDYIGEDKVNQALSRFLNQHKVQSDPYPVSKDLVQEFSKVTPDSLQYLIKDLFKTITLYDNRVQEAEYEATDDGQYKVTMTVKSDKYRADSLGKQKAVDLDDYVDVGVFAQSEGDEELGDVLYLQKHHIDEPRETFTVTVDQKPRKAGFDPYLKLIDRNKDDNVKTLEKPE